MRKILVVLLFLAVAFSACGQETIVYRDMAQAEWDAPVVNLVPGESIEYDVYLSSVDLGDPVLLDYASFLYVGRSQTTAMSIDMTLYDRVRYYLIVRTVFIRADSVEDFLGRADSLHDADPLLAPSGWYYVWSQAEETTAVQRLRDSGM